MESLSRKMIKEMKRMQRNEITEWVIYHKIAKRVKSKANQEILIKIANEEKRHYEMWKELTKVEIRPSKWRIFITNLLSIIFGYTFAIKLMEKKEHGASKSYQIMEIDIARQIAIEEQEHERELIGILDEERLHYVSSMVLGLNDALVEFTGSLAGYTFAMQNNRLITLVGLITGISATLSMAASEYLSQRSEKGKNPLKSSLYTGGAYLVTVFLLVLPYLLLPNNMYYLALGIMLLTVVIIIAIFNYYIAVAKDLRFKKRFLEMAVISLGVAAISFVIGLLVKKALGIDI